MSLAILGTISAKSKTIVREAFSWIVVLIIAMGTYHGVKAVFAGARKASSAVQKHWHKHKKKEPGKKEHTRPRKRGELQA